MTDPNIVNLGPLAPFAGICSGPFLDQEFQNVRFDIELSANDDGSWSYSENTHLKIKGQDGIFAHSDQNTLTRVG